MRAVENAVGSVIPDNARIIRNIINGIQYVQDHCVHFYALHALDWVDVASALKADPHKTSELNQAIALPDFPKTWKTSPQYFGNVQKKVKALVESGQLGHFSSGYWGHPEYKLPTEANLMAVAHYLEALDFQRDSIRIQVLLGGKNPHPQTWLVGGMAIPVDPNSQNAINANTIAFLQDLVRPALDFVKTVYIPDLLAVASFYKDWAGIGAGCGNFLSYGEFQNDNKSNTTNTWLPAGFIRNKNLAKVEPVDQTKVTEDVARAWYKYSDGDGKAKHPYEGETNPNYTGPKPPYEFLDTNKKYSWCKAIRYDGLSTEVGPLARMLVAYASGHKQVKDAVDMALKKLGVGVEALFSTLGRTAARGFETLVTVDMLPVWINQLAQNMHTGDFRIHNGDKWEPSSWPKEAKGYGFHEAPRGSLCHWVVIKDGKVANYQCVVPGGWNTCPRDAKGQPGPLEAALKGTPLKDPNRPLEILRTVHSFDPCMSCAIHIVDPNHNEIVKVRAL